MSEGKSKGGFLPINKEELLLNLFKKHFYSPLGLLVGIFLITLFFVLPVDDLIEKGIPNFLIRIFIYVGIFILWLFLWIYLKRHFPKRKKYKIGLITAVTTENDKQKLRIKNDFVQGVRDLLRKNNLLSLFDIHVLQDYKANKAGAILENYNTKRNELIKNNQYEKLKSSEENKEFKKLHKKIDCHFYIWGAIKERQEGDSKYFLNLEALVIHKPIKFKTSNKIVEEFNRVFPRRISFFEKLEVKGFEVASSYIYIAIRYITGIAALVSRDVFTAYNLHNGLQSEIEKEIEMFETKPKHLEDVLKRLKEFLVAELILQARYFYVKKDIQKSKELATEAEKIKSGDYKILIFNSILAFQLDRDPLKSLQYLKKARKVSKADYTWLYNKAFIYMYLEKFERGLNDYKRLRGLSFEDEELIVDQCIDFCEELLKNEPDTKQSYFILGYLYYVKKKNLPMALGKFEKFIEETKDEAKYEYLYVRAKTYLDEIKIEMKLKNTTV